MFDKLEDILIRFEEIMGELNEPTVTNNQERFRALMKEQSDLTPLVEAYREYKKCKQDVEDSLTLLETESDEDMKEMLKEELSAAKKRIEELEARDQEIDETMILPEVCTNVAECTRLSKEKAAIAAELEELYEKWEELA